ncbi:MAG: cell division protein FtsB [Gammaproteobacteria bacterium]|nr:MAG: cell division protein FtsB [Gammaproteobacteria bacterium]TDJ36438.1 MAG: cell division protein FtsB [Gammaproteobacteria bacterium]
MRFLVVMGVVLLIALQFRFWFGSSGVVEHAELAKRLDAQRQRTEVLSERNRILASEVKALKAGPEALEARARTELGMVKRGETFYLVVEP